MENWIYLFTAYSIVWVGMLGYLIKQFARQQRLAREVERLTERLEKIEQR
ncbi:MAG: CcmD family protein [Thermodesulfobacteriota bacterium]